jgi:hypothetical protein
MARMTRYRLIQSCYNGFISTDRVGDIIDGIAKIEFKDERIGDLHKSGKYIWEPPK